MPRNQPDFLFMSSGFQITFRTTMRSVPGGEPRTVPIYYSLRAHTTARRKICNYNLDLEAELEHLDMFEFELYIPLFNGKKRRPATRSAAVSNWFAGTVRKGHINMDGRRHEGRNPASTQRFGVCVAVGNHRGFGRCRIFGLRSPRFLPFLSR